MTLNPITFLMISPKTSNLKKKFQKPPRGQKRFEWPREKEKEKEREAGTETLCGQGLGGRAQGVDWVSVWGVCGC